MKAEKRNWELIFEQLIKYARKVTTISYSDLKKIRNSPGSMLMILAPYFCGAPNCFQVMYLNLFGVLADLKTDLFKPFREDYTNWSSRFNHALNFKGGDPLIKKDIENYLITFMLMDDYADKELDAKEKRYNPFNDTTVYTKDKIPRHAKALKRMNEGKDKMDNPMLNGFVTEIRGEDDNGHWW